MAGCFAQKAGDRSMYPAASKHKTRIAALDSCGHCPSMSSLEASRQAHASAQTQCLRASPSVENAIAEGGPLLRPPWQLQQRLTRARSGGLGAGHVFQDRERRIACGLESMRSRRGS